MVVKLKQIMVCKGRLLALDEDGYLWGQDLEDVLWGQTTVSLWYKMTNPNIPDPQVTTGVINTPTPQEIQDRNYKKILERQTNQ